ncbi:MAG TPA: site-2 protease family protein [Candidatus Paceibacterota bacterium]|nr:site-2 protease family protein [Candidatus Paceibacterota bacterium]
MSIILTIFSLVVFIYSVVIHEVSHGLAADSMGDKTARVLGRLSLNPLKHLDIFGSVVLPILLYVASGGGLVFGYAKPVPYNPHNLNDQKYGPIKVALAGPAANVLIALVFGLVLRFFNDFFAGMLIPNLFATIVGINLILAIFNLFPIPPLDGHWVLVTLLPARFQAFRDFLYRYSIFLFIFFIIFIYPYIFPLVPWLFRIITGLSF